MDEKSEETKNITFTLKRVAAWQLPFLREKGEAVVVGVPSLQRGAVWDAQQVEMLWDSIFRGFPIGSIVLTKKIETQTTKKSHVSHQVLDETTHHILDGQQRTNAITWGFDPIEKFPIDKDKVQCLWLDLLPHNRLDSMGNSRKYLFRLTTQAHKWGYRASEKLEVLNLSQRQKFMEVRLESFGNFPMEAGLPMPLSYLWQFFDGKQFDLDRLKDDDLFKQLCEKLAISGDQLEEQLSALDANYLTEGFKNAHQASLIGLTVTTDQIEDIEQIFLRLNRQGTPLDNEELIYSMIKAYWPEVEGVLSKIEVHHTTEARLISMALRVALHSEKSNLPERNIQQIRHIFANKSHSENEAKEREAIKCFFNEYLVGSLEWIDKNLVLTVSSDADFKLPRFLRSSVAWHSRDVFVWWLFLAKKHNCDGLDESQAKRVIAIGLIIHWFVKDKAKMVRWLVGQDPFKSDFKLFNEETKAFFHGSSVMSPDEIEAFLELETMSEARLKNWRTLWQGTVANDATGERRNEDEQALRRDQFIFLEKLLFQRELLLYVQAPYIEKFNYDPSNKLMWKGHNRPWDYDHVVPSEKLNGTGKSGQAGDYHAVCKTWQQTIGNLVAIDLSFNRSASDQQGAVTKYSNNGELYGYFDGDELERFDIELTDTRDFDKSSNFILAIKNRALRMYQAWYQKLDVEKLI